MNYDNSEVHRMVESCYRTSKTLVNPILEWMMSICGGISKRSR